MDDMIRASAWSMRSKGDVDWSKLIDEASWPISRAK